MAAFVKTNNSVSNAEGKLLKGENGKEVAVNDGATDGFLSSEDKDVEGQKRYMWSRKVEYLLTTIGYCVGLGNVWRFPYVCIRNGGGAFLIPFFICLVVCGLPLFFLEVAMGQFLSRGAFHAWNVSPLFAGMGWAMILLCFIFSWYYGMILAYTLVFLGHSVRSPLPWTLCGQKWNTADCVLPGGTATNGTADGEMAGNFSSSWMNATVNATVVGESVMNATVNATVHRRTYSASEEFWLHNVLELSPGLELMDGLPWQTSVALLVSSIVVVSCIIKGVHSVGKVVYVTATLPYILLSVLIIKGATLPGALDGIIFYLKPDFSKLLLFQTWVEASLQVFYSLGPAWGGLITMASYNKFNNNCMRDAIFLTFLCEGTSVFAGFAIFTILGHMAYQLDVPVANFSTTGPGLAFVVYPEAISYLPLPQLWGVLFFVMLFTLGLDSQFTNIETVLTAMADVYPALIHKWNVHFKMLYTLVLFLITLPLAARGGMYLFQLVDWYVGAFTVFLNGVLECVIIGWIYGAERFFDDIQMMLGKRPPYFFAAMWRFGTPMLLGSVWVITLMTYTAPNYQGYEYGPAGTAIGWFIAFISFIPIPAHAVYEIARRKGGLWERIKAACRPNSMWHPDDSKLQEEYRSSCRNTPLCTFRSPFTKSRV